MPDFVQPPTQQLTLQTIVQRREQQYLQDLQNRDRGFHVAHQKVSVDVNLHDWSLVGWTEIQIAPTTALLREIRLDCRQSRVVGVEVNDKKMNYYHQDVFSTMSMFQESTVNQHHNYRRGIDDLLGEHLPGELVIQLPKNFKIYPQDSESAASVPGNANAKEANAFVPIKVKIDFILRNATMGVNFVGGENSKIKKSYWHAYTTHSPLGQSTSNWLPCVDGLWEQCTWELEVCVPRTVRDIGATNNPNVNEEKKDDDAEDEDMTLSDAEREELDREIVAVSNSASSLEEKHPFDSSRKVVKFGMFSPLSAHHIGFAVGAFVQTPVTDLGDSREEEENEDGEGDSFPMSLYTFPHLISEAVNSCLPVYKAMEYFVREYGAYPFGTYSYIFVYDAQTDIASAAGMAICSDKLLFPPEVIEPLFNFIEPLSIALASQWCGVSIVPKTWNDMWVVVGIQRYMAHCFIRKLLGNNEYRFRMKKLAEKVCEVDVNKPPLANPEFNFPITEDDLWFLTIKAPAVLFILDRRMTKTDRSFGLSRVLPKLFLQSMSGDLSNSCISTAQFIRLCERVSHSRLDSFFLQWVFGSGYPIFRVTQRFNKKRMFVEMGIRQVQMQEVPAPTLDEHTFVHEAVQAIDANDQDVRYSAPSIFTGPMTIRIHEADGTPYEHVVDLKENFTKLDIQYNTKYKRLKRSKKQAAAAAAATGTGGGGGGGDHVDFNDEEDGAQLDGVLLHSLGDVLQSDADVEQWKLTDWTREEEDRMVNEAFEWIRVDADFEWICRLYINQPDYMYCSQLQQDRDVVAQIDAVQHFGMLRPSALYSSILVRTLMDRRYYYGVRIEAAKELTRCATDDLQFIGKFHLIKAFQSMFCFEKSTIPMGNDFSDFTNYFVQKAIPLALSRIRDKSGNCPLDVKNFLLALLRYNDNSNNPFSDCFYVCDLITSIVTSLKRADENLNSVDNTIPEFVAKAVAEIDRCCRMDAWLPSIQNVLTITAIKQKESLVREGYIPPKLDELIQYTKCGNNNDVRLAAFRSLLGFGALRDKALLRYVFATSAHDFSNYVRFSIIELIQDVVGLIALKGELKQAAFASNANGNEGGILLDGGNAAGEARRDALARTSVTGATLLVRRQLGTSQNLRKELWNAINDKVHYGVVQKRQLLDIAKVLYPAIDSYMVTLPTPRMKRLVARHLGGGQMVVRRELRAISKPDKKRHKKDRASISVKPSTPIISLKPVDGSTKPKIVLRPSSAAAAPREEEKKVTVKLKIKR